MLSLKHYRGRTIQQIEACAKRARQLNPKLAFYKQTDLPYRLTPGNLAPVPYVCIQIPTGGGQGGGGADDTRGT